MLNTYKDQIIIDGLQYCNWNRDLFEDLLKGGITAIHATVVYWENTEESWEKLQEWKQLFTDYQDIIVHAKKVEDIFYSKKNNKIAILLGFQNSAPIGNDIFLLEKFFSSGLRFMQLTYNNQTALGGGCFEKYDSGLSRFGYAVVEEMNRLGMIIDLSHAGKKNMFRCN